MGTQTQETMNKREILDEDIDFLNEDSLKIAKQMQTIPKAFAPKYLVVIRVTIKPVIMPVILITKEKKLVRISSW